MLLRPPRKWPPRVFAIYLVSTVVGGVVLILFLILIGLLYWMNARFPLPDAKRLIHPNATAWLVVKAESLNALPAETLSFLADGAPPQMSHLLARAGGEKPCPIQIVLSAFPDAAGEQREMSMAVSLGRYPGQFWLVRRDLERRVEKQSLPMSLLYHAHKAIFSAGDPSNRLPTLSLVQCTVLRCPTPTVAEALIDQMEKPPAARQTPAPDGASFEGWAASYQDIPFTLFFPESRYAGWPLLLKDARATCPDLAQSRDMLFSGVFQDRRSAKLKVAFHVEQGSIVLVENLAAFLNNPKKFVLPSEVTRSGDLIQVTTEMRFMGD